VPEWRNKYIDFDSLVDAARREGRSAIAEDPHLEDVEASPLLDNEIMPQENALSLDEQLKLEYNKLNSFVESKLKELKERTSELNNLTEHLCAQEAPRERDVRTLEKAYIQHYRGLSYLFNYITLNHTGIHEIVVLVLYAFPRYRALMEAREEQDKLELLNQQPFLAQVDTVLQLLKDTEVIFAYAFRMDVATARQHLSRPPKPVSMGSMFSLGLWIGCNIPMILVLLLVFLWQPSDPRPYMNSAEFFAVFPVHRGFFYLIIALWGWGCLLYVYTRFNINYVFIMQFDPPSALGYIQTFKVAAMLTNVWLGTFFFTLINARTGFHIFNVQWAPLVNLLVWAVWLIFPLRFFHRRSRSWLLWNLLEAVLSPFTDVFFAHFFVSDVLTSIPNFLNDLLYSACYYFSGDWLSNESARCTDIAGQWAALTVGLPLWIRFWQCLRRYYTTKHRENLFNALKYLLSFVAHVFGALHANFQWYENKWEGARVAWFCIAIISTIYLFYWDVAKDWGLLQPGSKHFLLRKTITFPPWVYYGAIILDCFGRFLWMWWMFNIPPPYIAPSVFTMLLSSVEVVRRFMWGIFRMENEHLNNCGQFRALVHIPLPMSPQDQPENSVTLAPVRNLLGKVRGLLSRNLSSRNLHAQLGETSSISINSKGMGNTAKQQQSRASPQTYSPSYNSGGTGTPGTQQQQSHSLGSKRPPLPLLRAQSSPVIALPTNPTTPTTQPIASYTTRYGAVGSQAPRPLPGPYESAGSLSSSYSALVRMSMPGQPSSRPTTPSGQTQLNTSLDGVITPQRSPGHTPQFPSPSSTYGSPSVLASIGHFPYLPPPEAESNIQHSPPKLRQDLFGSPRAPHSPMRPSPQPSSPQTSEKNILMPTLKSNEGIMGNAE